MPVQFADKAKHIGEMLRYSMLFRPGVAIGESDALTGIPRVRIYEWTPSAGKGVESSSMLDGTPTRYGNRVYFWVTGGTAGKKYVASIECDTDIGENDVREDLVFKVVA